MKVLITGASGFLGGHLVRVFREAGYRVRGMVRNTSRTGRLQEHGVEICRADLKDPESLRRAVCGVDVVVHAASTMSGVPEEYEEATIKGTRALLEAAEEAGVERFVHVSSISVCSMAKRPEGESITEDSPYEEDEKLLTTYSRSKIGSEKAALDFAESSDMPVVVLRPGILYGPGCNWKLSRMGYGLGRNLFVIIGNGKNTLPVCYVRNCARAALKAAENEGVSGGVFNVLDDELFTQKEYLKRLKRDMRPGLRIIPFPYLLARFMGWMSGIALGLLGRATPLHPAHLVACHRRLNYSNEKAKQELGWQPEVGREEALARTTAAMSERESLSRRARPKVLGRPAKAEKPLRCALVGCGMIARTHLKFLNKMKNAEVVAACDASEEAAAELAEEFGIEATFTSLDDMLTEASPDIVHVLSPPQFHAEQTEKAIEAGCHVLVEKPMAMNAAEARRMVECAAEKGVKICVDHNHLYDPVIVQTRRLVETGALGDILWVESYYGFNLAENPRSRYMMPGGGEHWTFGLPGGLYQNLMPHPLYLALELLGEPSKLEAHARYGRVLPHMPTDELRLTLETGTAGGLVTVSMAASPRLQYLRIYGTNMIVHVDLLNKWLIPQSTMRGVPKPISRALVNLRHSWAVLKGTLGGMCKVLLRRWTPYEGTGVLIREFYSAILEDREPPVTPEEAVQVMEVMDRTWELMGEDALRWPEPGESDRASMEH